MEFLTASMSVKKTSFIKIQNGYALFQMNEGRNQTMNLSEIESEFDRMFRLLSVSERRVNNRLPRRVKRITKTLAELRKSEKAMRYQKKEVLLK